MKETHAEHLERIGQVGAVLATAGATVHAITGHGTAFMLLGIGVAVGLLAWGAQELLNWAKRPGETR